MLKQICSLGISCLLASAISHADQDAKKKPKAPKVKNYNITFRTGVLGRFGDCEKINHIVNHFLQTSNNGTKIGFQCEEHGHYRVGADEPLIFDDGGEIIIVGEPYYYVEPAPVDCTLPPPDCSIPPPDCTNPPPPDCYVPPPACDNPPPSCDFPPPPPTCDNNPECTAPPVCDPCNNNTCCDSEDILRKVDPKTAKEKPEAPGGRFKIVVKAKTNSKGPFQFANTRFIVGDQTECNTWAELLTVRKGTEMPSLVATCVPLPKNMYSVSLSVVDPGPKN